ncbi:MAG: hypothetical protein U5R14_06065 [Gemmatimonadota bacterium]|nr:hypothetical protein [Gemmatimonadota bacterium]
MLDHSNSRIVLLEDGSGAPVRTVPLNFRVGRWAVLDDSLMALSRRPSGNSGEPLFSILSLHDGDVIESIGQTRPELAELDHWVLSKGRDGGFWAASIWDYRFHRWTSDTGLVATPDDFGPWFEDYGEWDEETYVTQPPPMTVQHVWESRSGLLWVYSAVPDDDWRAEPEGGPTPEWTRATFDTVVEVIDIASSTLVTRSRHDNWLAPVCGSESMYTVTETENGDTRMEVISVRLEDTQTAKPPDV